MDNGDVVELVDTIDLLCKDVAMFCLRLIGGEFKEGSMPV